MDSIEIFEEYVLARWFYLCGESRLSDIEYDKLEIKFKEMYPESPYATRPWSFDECPTELLKKIGREDLIIETVMGYMAESIPSINTQSGYEEQFKYLDEESRLSYKLDGWNTRASYYNGHLCKLETRGRSGNNLDLNHLYKLFPAQIPLKGKAAITGEMSIPNSKWEVYKALTGNTDQRASVRTAIARNDVEYLSFVAFNIFSEEYVSPDPYADLKKWGFVTPMFKKVSNFKELEACVKYLSDCAPYYDYLTDGLVIENSKYQLALRIGAWEEKIMQSVVVGYEENIGMYGTYLKVKIEPYTIEGKTYTTVSVNNISSIIENNLKIGSPIAFSQRSAANVVLDAIATRELQRRQIQ